MYKLIYLDNDDDLNELFALSYDIPGPNKAFNNIINLIKDHHQCKTVFIENNYIDYDYRSEFSNLYSKTFKQYSSICKRLHFFKSKINSVEELKNNIDKYSESPKEYIGYMVIRPTDAGKVGRTLISPSYKGEIDYPTCLARYEVHLFGKTISIVGTPFIQQDTMVMSCAQACLWMTAYYMNKKFNYPRYTSYQVTENASKSLLWVDRVLPSGGLSVFQMINALNHMGYSPLLRSKPQRKDFNSKKEFEKVRQSWNPKDIIYNYIESEIPVILGVHEKEYTMAHTIVAIGHTFKSNVEIESDKNIISSSEWTDSFIIHDDSFGPYRILPYKERDFINLQDTRYKDILPQSTKVKIGSKEKDVWQYKTIIDDIDQIIIPLHKKIYLKADEAEEFVRNSLNHPYILQFLNKDLDVHKEYNNCFEGKDGHKIVLRTYIMLSVDYKEKLSRMQKEKGISISIKKMDRKVYEKYQSLSMSRYIWVVEISTDYRFSCERELNRTIIGEAILDTTSNKYGFPFIALHIPGLLFLPNDERNTFKEPIPIEDDKPYNHPKRITSQ